MIISVSRRTDIPAFHAEWFMNRIDEGYALVRNPSVKNLVYRVPLDVRSCDLIAFITKNPKPMIGNLERLQDDGYRMHFQVTINPYGKKLEQNVPDPDEVSGSFRKVSEIIGKDRMMWRYDPIIFSDMYDIDFHIGKFESLCSSLEGYTERCCFNFLDYYSMNADNLREFSFVRYDSESIREFVSCLVKIAERYNISLIHCSNEFENIGVINDGCLGKNTMSRLNIPYELPSSPVRKGCKCVKTVDIGEYDTCNHNCRYCYANSSDIRKRSKKTYDGKSPLISGYLRDEDRVIDIPRKSVRITDFIS